MTCCLTVGMFRFIDLRQKSRRRNPTRFSRPACTPKEIIAKLNAAAVEALADPVVRSRLVDLGANIFPREPQTPKALGALVPPLGLPLMSLPNRLAFVQGHPSAIQDFPIALRRKLLLVR